MSASKAPKPCHKVIINNFRRQGVPIKIMVNWKDLGYDEFPNGYFHYTEEEILQCLLDYQRRVEE